MGGRRSGQQAALAGRILRVDLTTGELSTETLDEPAWRRYAGGSLLGTRLLMTGTRPGLEPFDPEALLVFASSAVAGRPAAGLPRFAIVGKSPLTGGIGEARAEGPFGIALKSSGFDAVVIGGRSDRPVTLTIANGRPSLGPSEDLWGLDTSAVVDAVTARLGRCNVATIGVAGERKVRFASIVSDRSFALPRMGLGAVMGAKRLKAVVIAGRGAIAPVADPPALDEISARYAQAIPTNPVTRWQHDPPGFGAWVGNARAGSFSVRNYRTSAFPEAAGYGEAAFLARLAWSTGGCPGCPSDCVKGFAAAAGPADLERIGQRREGGLHQEAIAALGPNLGLAGAAESLALNAACLRLGLDPVSLGFSLSFAMECRDRGLLASGDLDGVDLRFGAVAAAMEMTERIARREGAGDWLAEGSRRAAERLGSEAAGYALQVKGLEIPPFDPRAQAGLALGFATAPFGPRYDVAEHDADFDDEEPSWPHALDLSRDLGIHGLMPARAQSPEKVRRYAVLSEFWSALDALLVCPYASAPVRILSLADVAALVRAVTSWDVSTAEVLAWGARRLQLMRIYNLREGLSSADDRLPDRFFDEPIDAGPLAGSRLDRAAFDAMIAEYYALMGWDAAGTPTPATRMRHDLGWTMAAEAAAETVRQQETTDGP
jgi:aldehyde:ferredoxin oxidoreductase